MNNYSISTYGRRSKGQNLYHDFNTMIFGGNGAFNRYVWGYGDLKTLTFTNGAGQLPIANDDEIVKAIAHPDNPRFIYIHWVQHSTLNAYISKVDLYKNRFIFTLGCNANNLMRMAVWQNNFIWLSGQTLNICDIDSGKYLQVIRLVSINDNMAMVAGHNTLLFSESSAYIFTTDHKEIKLGYSANQNYGVTYDPYEQKYYYLGTSNSIMQSSDGVNFYSVANVPFTTYSIGYTKRHIAVYGHYQLRLYDKNNFNNSVVGSNAPVPNCPVTYDKYNNCSVVSNQSDGGIRGYDENGNRVYYSTVARYQQAVVIPGVVTCS